jgi:hypothetical protein
VFSTDILETMDIHHQLDRLRILKSLSHEESAHVYLALSSEIKSYDQINLVLQLHLIYFFLTFSYYRRCRLDTED